MKTLSGITWAVCLSLSLVVGLAVAADSMDQLVVKIQVAPKTFLLQSSQGGEITVHAEIAYSSVDRTSISMNGVEVKWTKADSRGELVAKFDEDALKAIVSPPEATMVLVGYTIGGEPFTGRAVVSVRDQ